MVLDRLREGLRLALDRIAGARSIDEGVIKGFVRDLQRALLAADVNVRLVFDISRRVEERALKERPPPGLSRRDHVIRVLYEELSKLMGEDSKLEIPKGRTSVMLLVGIQGSGKTTTAAKLARYYKRMGYRVGLVCADNYRPGALAQLKALGGMAGIEVYGDIDLDPLGIARRGVEYFKERGMDLVIIDTAGRHKDEGGLMEEMESLSREIMPDYTILVIDGTMGQRCYGQAKAFHSRAPIGGIVVSKLDGSAKGGGALAAAAATGAGIVFIGTGERLDDIEPFSPTRFVGRLLGMGDLKGLMERARELEEEADEARVRRVVSGRMTMEDFYHQLEQLSKLGPIARIFDMIPGISGMPRDELDEIERRLRVWRHIIRSMTREERLDPGVMNASRIRRVARGAGVDEGEVRYLLKRFKQARAMLKAGRGRGLRMLLKRLGHERI